LSLCGHLREIFRWSEFERLSLISGREKVGRSRFPNKGGKSLLCLKIPRTLQGPLNWVPSKARTYHECEPIPLNGRGVGLKARSQQPVEVLRFPTERQGRCVTQIPPPQWSLRAESPLRTELITHISVWTSKRAPDSECLHRRTSSPSQLERSEPELQTLDEGAQLPRQPFSISNREPCPSLRRAVLIVPPWLRLPCTTFLASFVLPEERSNLNLCARKLEPLVW
jgi:hypothetical protein